MALDEIEEIKHRIDIVEFISSYLTVKKAGANYRSLCPFHHEKSPSMMISPEKQIFKCFGCNEGGDVLTFVMKMENLEFREALEMLAARAGVKLEKYRQSPEYQKEKDQKTNLYQVNNWTARFFNKILTEHPAGKVALDYLKNRGLTDETIQAFMIGYAPAQQVLKQFLHQKNLTDNDIQAAGGPDRFYKRIVFPIRDVMGNILGFTGRVLEKGQEPKYLNTPETLIFHKGRVLFNLDRARGDIKLAKATVVVEGQMDVIASVQAGVKNVVATSGTALTEDHLRTLYRYTPNIIFSFDSDTAGLTTSKKAYEMAIAEGMNVKMANLGDFKDPGEMVAADPKLWQEAVEQAQPVIDWYFRLAFKNFGQDDQELSPQGKKEIAKELIPVIKKIPDAIEQAHYVGVLARKLKVAEQVIFDALKNVASAQAPKPEKELVKKTFLPEEILVGLLVVAPQNMKIAAEKIKIDDFQDPWSKTLYTQLLSWYNSGTKDQLGDFLKTQISSEQYQKLELTKLELETEYPNFDQTIIDILDNLKSHRQEKIKQFYADAIAQAEEKGDREKLKELVKEFQNAISK
ncbi:MAG: DNA primase [Candidatus Berkelbacteria bacterium]